MHRHSTCRLVPVILVIALALLTSAGAPPPAAATSSDGTWSRIEFPLPRAFSTGIYDPWNHRMLVIGGDEGDEGLVYPNDTWGFPLDSEPRWTNVNPPGAPYFGRYAPQAIIDEPAGRLILCVGGQLPWALSLTGTAEWTGIATTGPLPHFRELFSCVYDPARRRLIMFGGAYGVGETVIPFNDVWTLSLNGPATWTELVPQGTPPRARWGHVAVYDPMADRMVIFAGGDSVTTMNDVWELSLGANPRWTRVMPSGTPPPARFCPAAAYDASRRQVVVFGGDDNSGYSLNDVWTLDLAGQPSWTQQIPSGELPEARLAPVMICDPVADRIVIFGGFDHHDPPYRNDVWSLPLRPGSSWTSLLPSSVPPPPRWGHTAAYDSRRDEAVIFGGTDSLGARNDTWGVLPCGVPAWRELLLPLGPPMPRFRQSAVCDAAGDRMIIFAGRTGHEGDFSDLNDTWALSLSESRAWTPLATSGPLPPVRYAHTAILDPVFDRMIVFGGSHTTSSNDLWALSLGPAPSWSVLAAWGTPPAPRRGHTATYDPLRNRMLVFGGRGDSGPFLNDVWELSLGPAPAWRALTPAGTPPSGRISASAIYDPLRDRLVFFGGQAGVTYLDDAWELRLSGDPAWRELLPAGTLPSGRAGHAAMYDPVRDRMEILGGTSGSDLNEVWTLAWTAGTGVAAIADTAGGQKDTQILAPSPNPFGETTRITFRLAAAESDVQFRMIDVRGRLVRALRLGPLPSGDHTIAWDGSDMHGRRVAPGVYFVALVTGSSVETGRLVFAPSR